MEGLTFQECYTSDMEEEMEQPLEESPQDTQFGAEHTPMSDDDHAAALGFITSLSEDMLSQDPEANPPEEASMEAPTEEEEPVEKDDEQDQEIADIRAELERLLDDEDDQETEDTETPE